MQIIFNYFNFFSDFVLGLNTLIITGVKQRDASLWEGLGV